VTLLRLDGDRRCDCQEALLRSHVGGVPYAEAGDDWPTDGPARFLLQVRPDESGLGERWRGPLLRGFLVFDSKQVVRSYAAPPSTAMSSFRHRTPPCLCVPLTPVRFPVERDESRSPATPTRLREIVPVIPQLPGEFTGDPAGLLSQILRPGGYGYGLDAPDIAYVGSEPMFIQELHDPTCDECGEPLRFLVLVGEVIPGVQLADAGVCCVYGCDEHPHRCKGFIDSHSPPGENQDRASGRLEMSGYRVDHHHLLGQRHRIRGYQGVENGGGWLVAEEEKLKLGKGSAFVKSRLKRLSRGDEAWEADFQALPKPIMQSVTHYLGMVVARKDGKLLADLAVHGRPSVNDLATILAHAMRRPLDGDARRPRLVSLRGHHQWRELFPVLQELGVEVSVERKLPAIEKAYRGYLRRLRDEQRAGMIKPTAEQAKVQTVFPAIATYVRAYGYIEIGDQEGFGFVVRAIGYGGLDFEDDRPDTLAEAMVVLEAGLARWCEEQGIELD
jgi:hypothetical protein